MSHDRHAADTIESEGPAPSRRTALLRAAADGQLSPADQAALRDHLAAHPEDEAVIEFERALREGVGQWRAEPPSAALRARVAEIAKSAHAVADPVPPVVAGKVGRGRAALRWLAIAAVVALVSVPIVRVMTAPGPLPGPGEIITASHRASLCSFVRSQHSDCEVHEQMVRERFRIATLGEAPEAFRGILGAAPDLGDLEHSGVRFLGAMECAVPGRGTSVHLVLDAGDPGQTADPSAYVSLFVQQDHDELALEPGRTYRMLRNAGEIDAPAEIWVWRKDGLVYFLVAPSEQNLDAARTALGAMAPSATL